MQYILKTKMFWKINYLNTILYIFITILLLLVLKNAFTLRANTIDIIPEVLLDEYTWVWQGLSVKRTGVPAGWSDLDAYTKGPKADVEIVNFNIYTDKTAPDFFKFNSFQKPLIAIPTIDLGEGDKQIRFVQPLIEQPPLGGLIMGTFIPDNATKLLDVQSFDMRKSSLWLGVLTGILIFILSLQIFRNVWIALLSSAIYGSVPSYILLSRYALPENAIAPAILILFSLLVKSLESKGLQRNLILILAGISAGAATLIKITAWPYIFAGIFLLVFWKFEKKYLTAFVIPAVLIGMIYFLWAIFLDGKLFFNIIFSQGFERIFTGSMNSLIGLIRINTANFPLDGWWLGGFLALVLVPFDKNHIVVYVSVLTTIFTILFFGGSLYPWYLIPAVPFLCMAISFFLWRLATSPTPKLIISFFLIFFSSSFYLGFGIFKDQQPLTLYRLAMLFFIAATVFSLSYLKRGILKKIWFVAMVLIILQNLQWNNQSVLYILGHWGSVPYQSSGEI